MIDIEIVSFVASRNKIRARGKIRERNYAPDNCRDLPQDGIAVRLSASHASLETYKLNKFPSPRLRHNFPSLQESRHRANKGGNVISAI